LKEFGAKKAESPGIEFTDGAMASLMEYNWPGNVRELRNFAERAAVMYQGASLGADMVAELLRTNPEDPSREGAAKAGAVFPLGGILKMNYGEAKESFEKYYLEFKLSQNHGIISKTAEAIGIYPSNLHAKLRKYGIALQANKECDR
jgi:two-component system nitrogen regulation response regulator NtrX